ncbi:MAG: rhodanese-like domain-containing protein [Sedimenticola sp.]|nr:rhodanese-like domain-containing protein [Sedimenticola sp.]
MERETYKTLVARLASEVEELFPWDLEQELAGPKPPLLLDIRCPDEFAQVHIPGSLNVPRGILEMAVDYGYEETVPELVQARQRRVVVICRSGYRSILAARALQQMGFRQVLSLRTGLRGWNDSEQGLTDVQGGELDPDRVEMIFLPLVTPEQMGREAGLDS